MNTENVAESKSPAKEAAAQQQEQQQQQPSSNGTTTTEEKTKALPEAVPKTTLPTVNTINGFNTEEFLARVNMNEKINNILRSPTKTPNGVRQRSVFTAITPSSVSIPKVNKQ